MLTLLVPAIKGKRLNSIVETRNLVANGLIRSQRFIFDFINDIVWRWYWSMLLRISSKTASAPVLVTSVRIFFHPFSSAFAEKSFPSCSAMVDEDVGEDVCWFDYFFNLSCYWFYKSSPWTMSWLLAGSKLCTDRGLKLRVKTCLNLWLILQVICFSLAPKRFV